MTDPKILAELRELIARAHPTPWDLGTGWPFGTWNWNDMSDERRKATERIAIHAVNHAATLIADSERLRLAVDGLEKIANGYPDRLPGNEHECCLVASKTLAKIKDNECDT